MSESNYTTSQRGKTISRKSHARGRVSLVDDFGVGTELARMGVGALHWALTSTGSMAPGWACDDWKRLLSQAAGHDLDRPSPALAELGPAYGIDRSGDCHARPAEIAFALHTYYSLLVKLVLCQAMGKSSTSSQPDAAELAGVAADDLLLRAMQKLDDGLLWRALRTGDQDPFGWYLDAWCGPLADWVRRAAAVVARYEPQELLLCGQDRAGGADLFGDLYQGLLPKNVRHALGEYYTPSWLVAHMLDGLGYCGQIDARLLDPSCGSGNFLLAAIRRMRRSAESGPAESGPAESGPAESGSSKLPPRKLVQKIRENVVGFDLNPTAVLAARANYLLAIGDLIAADDPPQIPVHLRDSILDDDDSHGRFDFVAGNPPWIVWDNLSDDYREKTKPLWQRYGLFTLSGTAARHGGGKKDLSMLMTYVAADRYLLDGGRLGFVVTQTIFQTKGAGDGFRRFRLGEDGPDLRVLHVDDMVRFRPFAEAANWTGTLFFEKGGKTEYPLSYDRWRLCKGRHMPDVHAADDGGWRDCFQRERLVARPIDRERASSPWFVQPAELEADLTRLIGPSQYTAHLGANTGGANPVYWLRIIEADDEGVLVRNMTGSAGRDRKFEAVEERIEADLIYPLLRWGDVGRFSAVPAAYILLAQDVDARRGHDEQWMQSQCPRTLAYLWRFRRQLESRAAYKRYQSAAAFYSMYNVGRYTLAPIKVVWRRMDKRINAAVLEPLDDQFLGRRPVVPQETCVIVEAESADEAHYLAAALNSRRTDIIVGGHSVSGGKGFGTPSMLDYLRIGRFDPHDKRHARLARLSRLAHGQTAAEEDTAEIEAEIDVVYETLNKF